MLLAVEPHARVLGSVFVCEHSVAVLLVVFEKSLVPAAITPSVDTPTFLLGCLPHANVLLVGTIGLDPLVVTETLNFVVIPLAHVICAFFPRVFAEPSFTALLEETLKTAAVLPRLTTEALLFVAEPLTFVHCPVFVSKLTVAVRIVVEPVAVVLLA